MLVSGLLYCGRSGPCSLRDQSAGRRPASCIADMHLSWSRNNGPQHLREKPSHVQTRSESHSDVQARLPYAHHNTSTQEHIGHRCRRVTGASANGVTRAAQSCARVPVTPENSIRPMSQKTKSSPDGHRKHGSQERNTGSVVTMSHCIWFAFLAVKHVALPLWRQQRGKQGIQTWFALRFCACCPW